MRAAFPRPLSKVRTLTPTRVRPSRCVKWKLPISASTVRYHSTIQGSVRASKWTQHTLSSSRVPSNEPSELTRTSTKEHVAYIAFGSNLGDRIDWVERACREMSEKGIKVRRTSCLWETDPMYVLDQDKFVNGVCEVSTALEPIQLLDTLQGIERSLGREKLIDKGPRNIDLDILLYDEEVIDHERLTVPHPLMYEREFVLRPLAQLIPAAGLNPKRPWISTTDYLNALPPSSSPMSTITPMGSSQKSIRALTPKRRTQVMAIMNFTPDSFSNSAQDTHDIELDLTRLPELARFHTENGIDIFDVGGQSSRPNAEDITADEEISRAVPPIEQIRTQSNGLISIDTYRSPVAEAAVKAGADIINDISAGALDDNMLPLMAHLGKTVCLMHMRGTPATMQSKENLNYDPKGLIPSIGDELRDRVEAAMAAGVRRWRIILDPGIGFSKNTAQNLEIIRRFDELRYWPGLEGLPWLVGVSRKRFIGEITGVDVPRERVWGTAAAVAAVIQAGADIVRVHDANEMAQVAAMSDAIWRDYR